MLRRCCSRLIALAARHRLPALYPLSLPCRQRRSYVADVTDVCRRAASYVDSFSSARSRPMLVQATTKYELIINLKWAEDASFNGAQR
jgi:hypothetical protein